jgi:hypothetical protein
MKVFISYRRDDLDGHAALFVGRLRDTLASNYGEKNIFIDVESIPYGANFVAYLGGQVAKTDVLLAVIGKQWAKEMAARAGSKDDFVRIEIETALNRRIRVIPVLAGGASMPVGKGLPKSILPLLRRNAIAVDSGRDFGVHIGRLIDVIGHPGALNWLDLLILALGSGLGFVSLGLVSLYALPAFHLFDAFYAHSAHAVAVLGGVGASFFACHVRSHNRTVTIGAVLGSATTAAFYPILASHPSSSLFDSPLFDFIFVFAFYSNTFYAAATSTAAFAVVGALIASRFSRRGK